MVYPHTRFRYKVEIDGIDAGGFSEATGFDANIDVVEYREGDMETTPSKVPASRDTATSRSDRALWIPLPFMTG